MIKQEKQIQMIESNILADYIMSIIKKASHLKLQKLLYYIQGYHLAYFEKPIISDDFEAWVHGPVSKKLFDSLKDKSILYSDLIFSGDKNSIINIIKDILTVSQIELINEVLKVLGKYSGIELEDFTHSEEPWKNARGNMDIGEKSNNLISKDSIMTYFKTKIYG